MANCSFEKNTGMTEFSKEKEKKERILLQNNTVCYFLQLKNIFATIILCILMYVAGEAQVAIVHKNRIIAAVLRSIFGEARQEAASSMRVCFCPGCNSMKCSWQRSWLLQQW
jgi:hypothetical protein